MLKNIFLFFLVLLVAGVIFGITDMYLRAFLYVGKSSGEINERIFSQIFEHTFSFLGILLIYTAIKYTGLYLLSKVDAIRARFSLLTREVIIGLMVWMVILVMLISDPAETEAILSWAILIPCGILFYAYAFQKLIPMCFAKKRRPLVSYLLRGTFISFILFFGTLIVLLIFTEQDGTALDISFFNLVFQMFVTVPIAWGLYKRRQKGSEEVTILKKELTQSTASMDFLRSQINPHFLFNALNTLYGTALREGAERTSEGIEKLGNMMRFMLQENMQEQISLSREIEYLENYINLQKLRTDTSPNIQIQTMIENRETLLRIAPMLLIPFVENAFKHGISFREPSHIKVNLEVREKTLYFDVYNSKHARQEADPEKDKSGIGLENVRQRLLLLYPGRHELSIRDTSREFFVHLTIQLA